MLVFRALRRLLWWINRFVWWGRQRAGWKTTAVPTHVHPLDRKIMHQYTKNEMTAGFDAFCDLASIPLAFDVLTLLTAAETHRRKTGAAYFNVVFIIDASDPLPQFHRSENPVSKDNAYQVLFNIGILGTHLFEKVCDLMVFRSRKALIDYWDAGRNGRGCFPTDYAPRHPANNTVDNVTQYAPRHTLDYLNATGDIDPLVVVPPHIRARAQEWLSSITHIPFIVTLSLRETPNVPERNACIAEWQKLVDAFRDEPVQFVVVRDYFANGRGNLLTGKNVVECRDAVDDIVFRSALYECAAFNMLSNGGSALLCYLNPVIEFASFNVGVDADSARQQDMRAQWGLEAGAQLPANGRAAGKFRRLIWQRDEAALLIETLRQVLERNK